MARISPFEDLSGLAGDKEALRRKIDEDGFGLFRGLIPEEEVLELRRLILRMYQARGWLLPGTDPEEGIVDPSINEIESYASNGADQRAYQDVYRMKQFHQLAHHPAIVGLCEGIFGEPVFVHPRNIARLMAPHRETAPTPPHQDFIYVQGTRATYTCWIPLGDCPRELGGLSLMRGTHKLDILPVRGAEGAGGRTVVLDELDNDWVEGDLEVGDAILFHSHTVHRSLPNLTGDRVRLSCDYRYQPLSLPVEEMSLRPHIDLMTWEEAYEGWDSDELKYYWRDLDLKMVEFDWSILEKVES